MTAPVEIRAAGDSALVVELGTEIDATLNAQVVAIAATLRQEQIDGVRDVISSYASVTVCFDPLRTNLESLPLPLHATLLILLLLRRQCWHHPDHQGRFLFVTGVCMDLT